jgi:signal transduction histidine kinase
LGASFARERRFTADAAHELLNPLAAVRNEAEVALRRPRETAAYRQTLQTILTDVERLGKMVEQLLQLARIDADADLHREVIDLSRLGTEATARWQAGASGRQVALTCCAGQPAFVRANAIHLDTVVDNLLENALKYTPAGGSVAVAITSDDASVVLSVADSGIGFDPDTADRLFDRFHRAATPEVHAQPGSGLGLAIVRAIVQAYGGGITASSEGPGCGSRFVVQLPRRDGSNTEGA